MPQEHATRQPTDDRPTYEAPCAWATLTILRDNALIGALVTLMSAVPGQLLVPYAVTMVTTPRENVPMGLWRV